MIERADGSKTAFLGESMLFSTNVGIQTYDCRRYKVLGRGNDRDGGSLLMEEDDDDFVAGMDHDAPILNDEGTNSGNILFAYFIL